MYRAVNILEQAIAEIVDEIMPGVAGVCSCERCRADVICLTLNRLPPRYVVHRHGDILSRAEFAVQPKRAELVTAVMKAVKLIQSHPHQEAPIKPSGSF